MSGRWIVRGCSILDPAAPLGYRADQDILFDGPLIVGVSPSGPPLENERVFDGHYLLAVPGLINAHTHSPEHLLRGASEKIPLELWLVYQFSGIAPFPPELIYYNTLASAAEMLLSGVTAVLDHFWMAQNLTTQGLDAVMQAYRDSGMRAALAPMLEDADCVSTWLARYSPELGELQPEQQPPDPQHLLALMRRFLHKWQGQPGERLRCLLGPGGLQWCSDALLAGCKRLSDEYQAGFHLHVNETALQARVCQEVYGESAIQHLARLDVLNPASSLAHVVWANRSDLKLLADTRASVIHNPVSNLKLGSGIAPVMDMLKAGVTVGLGSDGPASNDNQNMFAVMKTAGLLHSPPVSAEETWISAREVFEMATANGARAVGLARPYGKIAPGMPADVTFLALDPLLQASGADLLVSLVYVETGESVRHVMVDGEWVVLDRQCLGFSLGNVRENLIRQASSFFADHPRQSEAAAQRVAVWKQALDRAYASGEVLP